MKLWLKKATVFLLVMAISLSPVYGAEQGDTYGGQLESVMQMILSNHINADALTPEMLFEAAMNGVFDILDPYSMYIGARNAESFTDTLNNSYVGIGVSLIQEGDYVVIERVFLDGPAYKGGLKVHDKIISAQGTSLIGKTPAEAAAIIIGEEGTKVTLRINRQGYEFDMTLVRGRVTINAIDQVDLSELYPDLPQTVIDQIGFLKISSFTRNVDEELEPILDAYKSQGKKYLLLDMRDNGGGYVDSAVNVSNLLVPEGPVLRFVNNIGREIVYYSELKDPSFEIVALVNRNSASATEFVAAAISESGIGSLVGETTYGKGLAQYLYTLDDGAVVKLTQETFYSRANNPINEIGVTPEVLVEYPKYLTKTSKFYPHDKNAEILEVERILAFLDYEVGTPDDFYDNKTFEAIKQFQSDQKVYAYGICDYLTQDLLNKAFMEKKSEKDLQLDKAVETLMVQMGL
ncbi:S41 family peptidase [Petrocella sp. FN5]|uniref:S41 family peptidase n=1 Tax=Petrocella sp. FN5 TaxID=3032002 RepID=UPI0023D9A472|nr:S41 family peptidase [Petrocella sp. FN5]MDF1617550.1 S41 family peptidase [Petrocella sp. FN5]